MSHTSEPAAQPHMPAGAERRPEDEGHAAGGNRGHVTFSITYDDTGAVVTVEAPNGWSIRKVIAEGYRLLGETPRPGDRVEADGVDLAPHLDLHVKDFVERGIAPAAQFNIVSNTGGAASCAAAASLSGPCP